MQLKLDINLAAKYKSPSQKIRKVTESWAEKEIFCPNCEGKLIYTRPNNPVEDFICKNCNDKFELKSKKGNFGYKIVNGAYSKFIEKLVNDKLPNFFFLTYDFQHSIVTNFFVIPNHFFSPSIIEKRTPLSLNARRSGWIGCNILIGKIPQIGRIYYVKNKEVIQKKKVKEMWKNTLFLKEQKVELRGWILDVMNCIEKIGKQEFSLSEVYSFEKYLAQYHPNNKHIKDKIRQQLQYLRDKGLLIFIGNGKYKKIY